MAKPLISKYAEIVFVDDTEINVDASKELGINGILFTDAAQPKADLKRILKDPKLKVR